MSPLKLCALAATLVLGTGAAACGDTGAGGPVLGDDPTGVYLALGDSIASGTGASDAERTGYPALIVDALGEDIELVSLALGGHTTQDLINQQLPAALDELDDGDVRLVTVTIGGNDLYQYAADEDCLSDPADAGCPLRDGLSTVREHLETILDALQDAEPEATIVLHVYPNLFSGTGNAFEQQAEAAFGMLDEVIIEVGEEHGVLTADSREDFDGRGDELTRLLDPTPDAHPNDAGYRVIAEAFLEVLRVSADSGTD